MKFRMVSMLPCSTGITLRSLGISLNPVGAVSICRTREILSYLFNVPLSEGTLLSIVSRCAGKLPYVLAIIRNHALAAEMDHADEIGFRVVEKLH